MTSEEVRARIKNEPDFVYLPQFGFSLKKLMEKYPEGDVPETLIARALMITEDEIEIVYQQVVRKLRRLMGVNRG